MDQGLKMLILLLSIIAISTGYYLLWVTPDLPYGEVVERAITGILLASIGGVLMMIYLHRRTR